MSHRSGLGAQMGFAAEVTYGTYVAPTRFLEFNSESLVFNREKIRSAGIRRGSTVQRTGRWAVNKKGGGGPTVFEFADKGFGLLLKHAMGASVITTPGGATLARLHTYTLADLDNLSLTVQVGAPDTGGVTNPLSYLGCVITGWELSVDVDGLVMFNPTFDAQDMVTSQSLAAASFASADELFSYQQVAITVDGGAETPTAASITCGHGMKTDRYFIQASPLKKRPVLNARRDLGGSMTFEFDSMVQVNRFLNAAPGAEIPITIAATGDLIELGQNYGLTATAAAAIYDGEIPVVQGPDVLTVTAPFEILDNSTNPPLSLAYTTTDTTD